MSGSGLKTKPNRHPEVAREGFAQPLAKLFRSLHIGPEHYEQLGRDIAAAQRPARALPYAPGTIEGWLSGALLPTPQAYEALSVALQVRSPAPEALALYLHGTLDEKLEDALTVEEQTQSHPSELSHAFHTAKQAMNRTYDDIAREQGRYHETHGVRAKPLSGASWCQVAKGKRSTPPAKRMTYELHRQLNAAGQPATPALPALHEQALRERADGIWNDAAEKNDLGGMIYACRLRLGESQDDFVQRIGHFAGIDLACNSSTAHYWEKNEHLPVGQTTRSGSTLCEPMVLAMKAADRAPNALARSIAAPWFDAGKETAFRRAFAKATEYTNKHHQSAYIVPARTLSDAPPKQPPSRFDVYEGSLATARSCTARGAGR